ncbi:protein TPX2 isoform X2 [Cryptomeria japonica]|uniref:protein TPX2 isoform X2 n=1 Tax=Cryptomeria japonica TaxID=3369 RepID=UPI0027DA4EA1|nr:protein TPX2 isoform X2 [Cryptomeria japonica]
MEDKRPSFTSSPEEASIADGSRTCDDNIDNENPSMSQDQRCTNLKIPFYNAKVNAIKGEKESKKNVKFNDHNRMHKVRFSKLAVEKDMSSYVKVESLAYTGKSVGGHKESLDSKAIEKSASQVACNGKMGRGLTGKNLSSCSNTVAALPKNSLLKPTRQGCPELETAQRVRPMRVKSSIEIQEGLISKIPKLVSHTLHRKSAEKQGHSSVTRVNMKRPKESRLENALCALPPKLKTSEELEQKELENLPAFSAGGINGKRCCSKGSMGIVRVEKHQATTPVLLVKSEPQFPLQQATKPQPFNLATEDRGIEKERKFISQLQENERKEQKARIPKANPLPYSTDSPVIPPKPQSKECTKPEPFKLESVIRHEEELKRIMEEHKRFLREEAEMKNFRARPIMNNFTKNVCRKVRMPLTEVQEFNLRVDSRAIQRAEFDRRIKEKEIFYMRLKAESEAAMKAGQAITTIDWKLALLCFVWVLRHVRRRLLKTCGRLWFLMSDQCLTSANLLFHTEHQKNLHSQNLQNFMLSIKAIGAKIK